MAGNVGGQPFANVFHVETDTPGITTAAGVSDMLDAFDTKLVASGLIAQFSSTLHVTQLRGVVQLDADSAVESQKTVSHSGVGAAAALPASACVVLSWLSPAYWRGGKPRTYMGGVTTAMIDNNHSLTDSLKADIQAAAATLRTGINSITTPAVDQTTLGVVSYASAKVWRTTPLFLPFNGVTVHDRLGTQRRRLGAWLP